MILWILAGCLITAGAFCMVVMVVNLEQRAARALTRRLQSHLEDASGVLISVPGRGWVPSDGRFTRG